VDARCWLQAKAGGQAGAGGVTWQAAGPQQEQMRRARLAGDNRGGTQTGRPMRTQECTWRGEEAEQIDGSAAAAGCEHARWAGVGGRRTSERRHGRRSGQAGASWSDHTRALLVRQESEKMHGGQAGWRAQGRDASQSSSFRYAEDATAISLAPRKAPESRTSDAHSLVYLRRHGSSLQAEQWGRKQRWREGAAEEASSGCGAMGWRGQREGAAERAQEAPESGGSAADAPLRPRRQAQRGITWAPDALGLMSHTRR